MVEHGKNFFGCRAGLDGRLGFLVLPAVWFGFRGFGFDLADFAWIFSLEIAL